MHDRLGERLSTFLAMRKHHGRDESLYDPVLPHAVAYAKSVEDFSAVLTLDSWSHLEIGAKMLLSVVGVFYEPNAGGDLNIHHLRQFFAIVLIL